MDTVLKMQSEAQQTCLKRTFGQPSSYVCIVKEPPKVNRNRTKISGLQKGPAARGHVKKRQKSSKNVKTFSTFLDNFRAGQKTSKIVKKCQKCFDTFRQFSRGTLFPALLGGGGLRQKSHNSSPKSLDLSGSVLLRTVKVIDADPI